MLMTSVDLALVRPGLSYVDVNKHWRKLGPIAKSQSARRIWLRDMLEYCAMWKLLRRELKWTQMPGIHRRDRDFLRDPRCPSVFDEDMFWRWDVPQPRPKFLDYVCKGASHWLVNLNLFLASSSMPQHAWRIITSTEHSTVWNGEDLLFDMNSLAMGVPVEEAWKLAHSGNETRSLKVSQQLDLVPWSKVVQAVDEKRITMRLAVVLHEWCAPKQLVEAILAA